MNLIVLLLISFGFGADGQGAGDYFFNFLTPFLGTPNPFDGPASISNRQSTPSSNTLPTVEQMMYYNYYAASLYYMYDPNDFNCELWLKIKPDICNYEVIYNEMQSTLAIVALSQVRQEIVVSIRGTTNIQNGILNLSVKCDNIPGRHNRDNIKIHTGFYAATMSLYSHVVEKVSNYLKQHRKFKIVLTGHSLGAAMARTTFFLLKDSNQFPGVVYELYTYGEPRVGNQAFADYMNSQPITSARVVSRRDLIPHLPPTSFFGTDVLIGDNYIHPQTEFWINEDMEQKFANQSYYEDPNCSMSMGPVYNVPDHFIYFDIDLSHLLETAFGIIGPVKEPPPPPSEKIENSIGDALTSALQAFSTLFG